MGRARHLTILLIDDSPDVRAVRGAVLQAE
jgi:hypothetical protein